MMSKRYMNEDMKATEVKFLKNERKGLLADLNEAIMRYEAMAHGVVNNKKEILKIKEHTKLKPAYLEEQEGKNRVSYLKKIIDEATRDKRYENDELIDLKRAQGERLFYLRERIKCVNEEINYLQL